MPLYEYRCRKCENVFEYMQGLSEGQKRKCEDCGGRLEKLVSRAGFVLKGSGWYETDFKNAKPAAESKEKAPAKDADSGKAQGGKEGGAKKADSKAKTPKSPAKTAD